MPRVAFRKLRRWTFAIIAVASLVLCLATVGLWVRSVRTADAMGYTRLVPPAEFWADDYHIDSQSEYFRLGRIRYCALDGGDDPVFDGAWFRTADADARNRRNSYFLFAVAPAAGSPSSWTATFPHWSLALLFAIVPTWWGMAIVRGRRLERSRQGCCANCGYDLRASRDRCPECGKPTSNVERHKAEVQTPAGRNVTI